MNEYLTRRLRLRAVSPDDAPFVHELVNDPDWIRYIGDRGVRSVEDARSYVENGPLAMERRTGFGMQVVERLGEGVPLGMCGLVRREALPAPDLGFAFLPAARGAGYAAEAAAGTLAYAKRRYGLGRVLAVATSENDASIRLLGKLGFRGEGTVELGTVLLRLFEVRL